MSRAGRVPAGGDEAAGGGDAGIPGSAEIITMRSTGELAFVGFGWAVVIENANAAVQAKLNLNAQRIAAARAKDALCGLIIGDRLAWEGRYTDTQKDESQEFTVEADAKGDPLAPIDPGAVKRLDQARQEFVMGVTRSPPSPTLLSGNDMWQ